MYPVDCERSEEHGSSAGGTLVTPAAVHGISVGLFVYVGRFSGPISVIFLGGSLFFPPSSLRGKIRAAARNPPLLFCSSSLSQQSRS